MANFPDIKEIAGKHSEIFEAYYKGLDPKNTNVIEAADAARFLKKSGLSDVVLSRIWDLSDPTGKGYFDKPAVFVALKLVAIAQAGEVLNTKYILTELKNPPKVGDLPKIKPPAVPKMTPINNSNTDWSIKPDEKIKYQQLFISLQPNNNILPGNKVKGLLMDSKLPIDTLSTIWELADQDKDGSLDEYEFTIAMHLVYKALDKKVIPSSLPKELQKPPKIDNNNDFGAEFVANFPAEMVPIAAPIPVIPMRPIAPPSMQSQPLVPISSSVSVPKSEWVLTTIEKLRYQEIFEKSDMDMDGLVSGLEIRDVFLKSGIPQNCLAHIWALCDTKQSGKLNTEEFALAMWMVERKKKGIDPPQVLAPEMVPPCMRPNSVPLLAAAPLKPLYTNPELEMISKEIEELAKERHILEAEVSQKEADIRIKTGEVRSLQSELDTLTATLKQLENQKGEAQKRLDDLKAQVNKIRDQCQKQEETLKDQEVELDSKKEELQKLKEEEHSLQNQYHSGLKDVEKLTTQLQDTQLQISQVKAMVSQLEEIQRQMKDALLSCKNAIEENSSNLVSDYSLNIEPEFREFKQALLSPEAKAKAFNDSQQNAFNDSFKSSQKTFDDSFESKPHDFGDDEFGKAFENKLNDPYKSNNADPFGTANGTSPAKKEAGKDDFGSDPFAILHAPTQGSSPMHAPESPSPALPPKNKKAPPPRPAPPRPTMGPKPPQSDAFGSSSFANFDDFDVKVVSAVTTPVPAATGGAGSGAMETAADFSEDPFKNYRYEDPFLISDPFQEEKEKEKADIFNGNNADDLFAKFEEKIQMNSFNVTDTFSNITNDTNNNSSNKDFDPFGGGTDATTKNDAAFGFDTNFSFEANFDDDNAFDKMNDNFSNLNNNDITNSMKTTIKPHANGNEKKKDTQTKFSEDYSANFEMDLKSALERSVIDK
ncbi:unnamed protein product [Diamesa tonsa]